MPSHVVQFMIYFHCVAGVHMASPLRTLCGPLSPEVALRTA